MNGHNWRKECAEALFPVERERIIRSDGQYSGWDNLWRPDTGQNLGPRAEIYKLLSHEKALGYIHDTLDTLGRDEAFRDYKAKLQLNETGSKMYYNIKFPNLKVSVDGGAHDSQNGKHDWIWPQITGFNSYDGTTGLGYDFGAYRIICSNGAMIGQKVFNVRVKHVGDEIRFDDIADRLAEKIYAHAEYLGKTLKEWAEQDAWDLFAVMLTSNVWRFRNRKMILEEMDIEPEIIKDENGKKTLSVPTKHAVGALSKYALWCILTQIATHKAKSVRAQRLMLEAIKPHFNGGPK